MTAHLQTNRLLNQRIYHHHFTFGRFPVVILILQKLHKHFTGSSHQNTNKFRNQGVGGRVIGDAFDYVIRRRAADLPKVNHNTSLWIQTRSTGNHLLTLLLIACKKAAFPTFCSCFDI